MRRASFLLLVLVFLLGSALPVSTGQASQASQIGNPARQAQALLARLTPEEKVGQLFLVTFKGTDVSTGTQINDLIKRYHIGGVVFTAANDNFIGPEGTVNQAYQMTTDLQRAVWESYQEPGSGPTETPVPLNYIPLLIGISQEGDGAPSDQLYDGVTPLPSQMSIGATWKTDLSREAGNVMGSELEAMGFNLLFGPSLDVIDTIPSEAEYELGTRTFGGNPYWAGQMGQTFIQGLHEGSKGRLAVIAKNFPGRGAADRSSSVEVATVRKTLDQLQQDELVPFYAVTGNASSPAQTADGLLVSHIRYDFQGSVRPTTRPVSFDQAALDLLLKLPALASWRTDTNGVLVSDDLGSVALRRYYDTSGQVFDARQVARNAFLAGNDLLYLDNFLGDGDPDTFTTIMRTATLFAQKYREDRAFAERVDASVTRLLEMKFRMYPTFNIGSIIPGEGGLAKVGQSQQVAFEIARQSATLINPSADEMETVLPRPPGTSDRIVFITDVRGGRQCNRCPDEVWLAGDALQHAVMRLYGPQSGGQVYASRLSSYSTMDLINMLNGGSTKDLSPLEQDLRQAGWIVFAMLDDPNGHPELQAVKRFLSERPDLYRARKVIAFSFNAPYYMDATDISKLTAYYALYSKAPAFVDVAARILFQELTPSGSSPVSVPGEGYNLDTVTSPDPKQIIALTLDTPQFIPQTVESTTTLVPTPVPVFKVGDILPLRTDPILDHNQNQVPDGTPVRFLFTVGGETGTVQQMETTTTGGVARAAYRIMSTGLLEVRVISGAATTSQMIRLDISASGGIVTPIIPTLPPTETPTPTETLTPTETPEPTPAPLAPPKPGTTDWILAMLVIWGGAGSVFLLARQRFSLRWGLRWSLLSAAGGLLGYLYFAILRLAREDTARQISTDNILLVTFLGVLLGLGGGWIWHRWMDQRAGAQPERHSTGPKSRPG